MSKDLKKILKKNLERLFENFENMEVAFGTKKKSDLSDIEKEQFGSMGQLKTSEGGSFKNPITNGMKAVNKANKEGGTNAKAYYKEVAKKIKDYQTPNDKENFDEPKVPTNGNNENERLETTGYDVGISGMEVTADLASQNGPKSVIKKYKERIKSDDSTVEKMMKNAKKTNDLKYKKEANNTRPVRSQKSIQSMTENEYKGVEAKNIFKVKGKLVSEQQVLKLANKVPSRVKIDETTFAITDGENTYKLIWEGDSKNGEAVITNFKNNQLVNEDIQRMKRLWNFKSSDTISTKKNITESGEYAFNRMLKLVKESNFDWVEYNVSPAEEFIYHKFKECELIKNSTGWTRYIDPNGNLLFVDNIEIGDELKVLYFSDQYIYKKLKEMGLSYDQMKDLIKDMLWEVHKRKVDAAQKMI